MICSFDQYLLDTYMGQVPGSLVSNKTACPSPSRSLKRPLKSSYNQHHQILADEDGAGRWVPRAGTSPGPGGRGGFWEEGKTELSWESGTWSAKVWKGKTWCIPGTRVHKESYANPECRPHPGPLGSLEGCGQEGGTVTFRPGLCHHISG